MSRSIFPDDLHRYLDDSHGLLAPAGTAIGPYYVDEACTEVADLLYEDDTDTLAPGVIVTAIPGVQPWFQGPDDVDVVYLRRYDGAVETVYPRTNDLWSGLQRLVAALAVTEAKPSEALAHQVITIGNQGWSPHPDMAIGFDADDLGAHDVDCDWVAAGPIEPDVHVRLFDPAAPPNWCTVEWTARGHQTSHGGDLGSPATQYADGLTELDNAKWATLTKPASVTTVAVASNGATLPASSITVASASGLLASGQVIVLNAAGAAQIVTYTGVSGSQLTGCSGGTGTLATGGVVGQLLRSHCYARLRINVTAPGTLRPQFGQASAPVGQVLPVIILGKGVSTARPGSRMDAVPRGSTSRPLNGTQWTSLSGPTYKVQTPFEQHSVALAAASPAPSELRFELHQYDQRPADAAKGKSTERVEMGGADYYKLGDVVWVSQSILFSGTLASGLADTGRPKYVILNQFIQTPPDEGETKFPTVFAIYLREGHLQLHTRGDPAEITTTRNDAEIQYAETWADDGVWFDLVYKLTLHHTDGALQAWKNGVQICDAAGISTFHNGAVGSNDLRGARHKFGLYRSSVPYIHVARIANLEIGRVSDGVDLTARITAPLAHPA